MSPFPLWSNSCRNLTVYVAPLDAPVLSPFRHITGNRESAQRSRDAKKNHQQELESRVQELESQLAVALGGQTPVPALPSSSTSSSSAPPPSVAAPSSSASSSTSAAPPTSYVVQSAASSATISPPTNEDLSSRLELQRENVELKTRVTKLEELVRGLVRMMGQVSVADNNVIEPMSMGGLAAPVETPIAPSVDAPPGFGTFTPEEFAFAEHLVANASLNQGSSLPSPMVSPTQSSPTTDFSFSPPPLDGTNNSFGLTESTPSFDYSTLPVSSPRPFSPDYNEFLNPFTVDENPLANFQFVSDSIAAGPSRRDSSPMSDVSFGSVSSATTLEHSYGHVDSPEAGSSKQARAVPSSSTPWVNLSHQPIVSGSRTSSTASTSQPQIYHHTLDRPLPSALLRRSSSRPGSPMQISPPASPRTLPWLVLSSPSSPRALPKSPVPRPGTPTHLLRTSSTLSMVPSTGAKSSLPAQGPTGPSVTSSDASRGRSSRSALGRGSRHLQRVFSGTAAGPSATTSDASTSSSAASLVPGPALMSRTSSNSSLKGSNATSGPRRPISPLQLGVLGLKLTDLMAQHQHQPPTEKMKLVQNEFQGLGMGGLGSPRSVGCY